MRRLFSYLLPDSPSEAQARGFNFIVLLTLLAALALPTPSYLMPLLLSKIFGTPPPKPPSNPADLIVVTIFLILVLFVRTNNDLKRSIGQIIVLIVCRSAFILTTSAEQVLRWRRYTGPLGTFLLAVSLGLGLKYRALLTQEETAKAAKQRIQERARTEFGAVRESLFRFIERQPISEQAHWPASALQQRYEALRRQFPSYKGFDSGCESTILGIIDEVFVSDSISPSSSFEERIDALLGKYPGIDSGRLDITCGAGPGVDLAYLELILSRLSLNRCKQGELLDRVVGIHRLLIQARIHLASARRKSSALENALGNVYSYYLAGYPDLVIGYSWSALDEAPMAGTKTGVTVGRAQIANLAYDHLEEAKRLELSKDPDFALSRFMNNESDLQMRLALLVLLEPVVIDSLSGLRPELQREAHEIRRDPGHWLLDSQERLGKGLIEHAIPQGFVTYAQLASLSRLFGNSPKGEILSPNAAIATAIMLGFRDEEFFRNPRQMHMCPLITSPGEGQAYLDLVERLMNIGRKVLSDDCA